MKLNRNILFTYFGPDTNLNLLEFTTWLGVESKLVLNSALRF